MIPERRKHRVFWHPKSETMVDVATFTLGFIFGLGLAFWYCVLTR